MSQIYPKSHLIDPNSLPNYITNDAVLSHLRTCLSRTNTKANNSVTSILFTLSIWMSHKRVLPHWMAEQQEHVDDSAQCNKFCSRRVTYYDDCTTNQEGQLVGGIRM